MPLSIERTRDRVKLTADEIEKLVREHIEQQTGRVVGAVEFHMGRGSLGAATATLKFKEEE